ncbi:VIT family protein [Schaalia sp. 19OD2882]|uniref:VIT1/CCC1 transporter family protein n=1 Tax=Schaalia sp. 19OD2882 TaxID=2794089 RepID=UPI001C1EB702|nr:VIT family protein [Schaalia sp. 19OD2882]QWW20373.1 VIT family protein [Schaalia sp. 19OD2882]
MSALTAGFTALSSTLRPGLAHSSPGRTQAGTTRSGDNGPASVASRLNWLRAGVLGANDGIVSISGLLVGVAAVDPGNTAALAIAGVAGICSAALSMSVGEYVSVSTQRDTEETLVAAQRKALADDPQGQEARLAGIWQAKGLKPATAALVAKEQSATGALEAHLTAEHNLDPDDLTNPWAAAASSFLAFLLGAALPLVTMLVLPTALRIPGTVVSVLVALALTGWTSAVLGQAPRLRAVTRLVVGGGAAMLLTWVIGHLFGITV